jgi:hypothetical protein
MTDEQWIAKTIVPKSDQLNADDLITGPITVTIEDVCRGDDDQPVSISITDHQPYKPCKTMRRMLICMWGDRAADWIGRRLTLFADPNVKWGGVAVGGIRISDMSNIDQPHTVMLTVTRGKRQAFTVQPLADEKQKPAKKMTVTDRVAWMVAAYEDCHSPARLDTLNGKLDTLAKDCDDEQTTQLKLALDAAIARSNEGAN